MDIAHFPPLRSKGFTLLELVVVICIIAILGSVLMNRIWFYQEQAERAAMEQVEAALQSALTLQYGKYILRGKEKEASVLATENPMDWLAKKPANYEGEFYNPTPQSAAPGSWIFDLKSRELVYLIDRSEYFTPGKDGVKWIRYRITLVYEDVPGDGGKAGRVVAGAVLEPADSYLWFDRRLR